MFCWISMGKLPIGFKEFLIKSCVFIALFVLVQILVMGLVSAWGYLEFS